jgi:hypothetical protein
MDEKFFKVPGVCLSKFNKDTCLTDDKCEFYSDGSSCMVKKLQGFYISNDSNSPMYFSSPTDKKYTKKNNLKKKTEVKRVFISEKELINTFGYEKDDKIKVRKFEDCTKQNSPFFFCFDPNVNCTVPKKYSVSKCLAKKCGEPGNQFEKFTYDDLCNINHKVKTRTCTKKCRPEKKNPFDKANPILLVVTITLGALVVSTLYEN